ncbi:MAG: DUF5663 domain-containing protein [Ignavibacteria bacterium]
MEDNEKIIEQCIDDIISTMNEDLSLEIVEQLKSDYRTRIEDRINIAILDNIPKEKQKEFENLLDTEDEDKIQDFLFKNVPNFGGVVINAIKEFRQLYIK